MTFLIRRSGHGSPMAGWNGLGTRLGIIICISLFVQCIGLAEVSSTPPRKWRGAASIDLSLGSRLEVSHNSPEVVRQELLDTNIVCLLAKSSGLTEEDLAAVQLVHLPGSQWLEIYQVGKSETAFKLLNDQLRNYVRARAEGHTREFVVAALTNGVAPSTMADPALRAIATNQPLLAVSWLRKAESGTITNKASRVAARTLSTTVVQARTGTGDTARVPQDEVCRWVSYVLVDGDLAWRYLVQFKADGSLDFVQEDKCDAKTYEAKYQTLRSESGGQRRSDPQK